MNIFKPVLLSLISFLVVGCSLFNSGDNAQKYNPQKFSAVPAEAPFTISLEYEKVQKQSQSELNLQLNIHNEQSTPLGLTTLAHGTGEEDNYYQFIITKTDTTEVWKMLKSNTLLSAQGFIKLDAGETQTFSYNWDYTDNEGKSIKKGEYLLFGGLWNVEVYDDTTFTGPPISTFKKIGLGRQPVRITVKP